MPLKGEEVKRGKASTDDAERAATARIMTETMKTAINLPVAAPLEPADILRIVSEMQCSPGDPRRKAQVYSRKYPAFMEQCPALFQKACRPNMDMNMLRFMVSTMKNNDEEESSNIVGARLAERFVKPNVVRDASGTVTRD